MAGGWKEHSECHEPETEIVISIKACCPYRNPRPRPTLLLLGSSPDKESLLGPKQLEIKGGKPFILNSLRGEKAFKITFGDLRDRRFPTL